MRNHQQNINHFFEHGWCQFGFDEGIATWVKAVLPHARKAVSDSNNARWLRCGDTWFAGVNVLPNRPDSSVNFGPVLQGAVIDFIHRSIHQHRFEWDTAQVSVCYPGYPQPMDSESENAFRYRLEHDAAHIDGLLPVGERRRRHLREHHGFILGIPLVNSNELASPCVVWEGSHELVRDAMQKRFDGVDEKNWHEQDITERYHDVRHQVFEQCRRVPITVKPGECYLIHRLALHGVAPWQTGAEACIDGRMICYFRPEFGTASDWLNRP